MYIAYGYVYIDIYVFINILVTEIICILKIGCIFNAIIVIFALMRSIVMCHSQWLITENKWYNYNEILLKEGPLFWVSVERECFIF